MKTIIRKETPADYREVENLIRESFWNVYRPGCLEHFVIHQLRNVPAFVQELDFVMELGGRIIGQNMFMRAQIQADDGRSIPIMTMGPICIANDLKRQGYGKALLEHSFARAVELGYDAVVIFGNPGNYVSRGMVSCRKMNVSLEGGVYPCALLVKELVPGALGGKAWVYRASTAADCCEDTKAVAAFDAQFPPKEKAWAPSQEEFYIYCHAVLR